MDLSFSKGIPLFSLLFPKKKNFYKVNQYDFKCIIMTKLEYHRLSLKLNYPSVDSSYDILFEL